MNTEPLDIVIIGLSLSSSWGNGHATTYRSLVKGLHREGHRVTFLEKNVQWYADNRDLEESPHCLLIFYDSLDDLRQNHEQRVREADIVVTGSYLDEGVAVGEWATATAQGVTAFYDIDTPVTISKLEKGDHEYLEPGLVPKFDLYLSFSGGDVLNRLEREFGARSALPFYCSVDTDLYHPMEEEKEWELGYLGTYSPDRQDTLETLMLKTARERTGERFVVAGPQFPPEIEWPENVQRINHLPPGRHCRFYNRQRYTLNVTRRAMIDSGYSPSVRLFEAAACQVPVISDWWEGLDTFFEPGREILVAESTEEALRILREIPERERKRIARNARDRVMKHHTSRQRGAQLVQYAYDLQNVTA